MDFNYLGFVRTILGMNKQSDVTVISTDPETDAYKVQRCVNETIADLGHVLRIKGRITTFEFSTVVGQRTYTIPLRIEWPILGLRQVVSGVTLVQLDSKEYDMLVPKDESSGDSYYYYLDGFSGVKKQATNGLFSIIGASFGDRRTVTLQGSGETGRKIVTMDLLGLSWVDCGYGDALEFIESVSVDYLAHSGSSSNLRIKDTSTGEIIYDTAPHQYFTRYCVIGLYPIPNQVMTIYGRGYLNIPTLTFAGEVPLGLDNKHQNAIIIGSHARYMRYNSDNKIESIQAAFEDYYSEIQKIIAMDNRNPDKAYRLKGSNERRILNYFRPLDIHYPY